MALYRPPVKGPSVKEYSTMDPTVSRFADKSFGAIITDVDLNAIEPAAWQIIEDAFHEHAALGACRT
jgi:hypothetical protein